MNEIRRVSDTLVAWLRRHIELLIAAGVVVTVLILGRAITSPDARSVPPTTAVTEVTGWALPLLISSVALGFLVMAIVQLLKPSLRAQFHRNQITRWLKNAGSAGTAASEMEPYGYRITVDEFLRSVSQADPDALLELPIEQLTAQVQAAVELEMASGDGILVWAVVGIPASIESLKSVSDASKESSNVGDEVNERRSTLNYQTQRRLDALQIEVRQRWRRYLRFLCMLVSAAITSVLATVFGYWTHAASTALVVILLSALGTFFASVARDAVAILERLRM